MPYCSKCGAYIPDGQTVCLACGYDGEAEEKSGNSSAASETSRDNYYSFTNEELKQRLNEQREKQREQSRKWAEAEKQRRENQRSEREKNTEKQAPKASTPASNTTLFSVLSYISFLFILPMLFCEEDKRAMFHAKQGLRLFIYSLVSDALSSVPILGTLLNVGRVFFILKGIINVLNGREKPLPYIGTIGDK